MRDGSEFFYLCGNGRERRLMGLLVEGKRVRARIVLVMLVMVLIWSPDANNAAANEVKGSFSGGNNAIW